MICGLVGGHKNGIWSVVRA